MNAPSVEISRTRRLVCRYCVTYITNPPRCERLSRGFALSLWGARRRARRVLGDRTYVFVQSLHGIDTEPRMPLMSGGESS